MWGSYRLAQTIKQYTCRMEWHDDSYFLSSKDLHVQCTCISHWINIMQKTFLTCTCTVHVHVLVLNQVTHGISIGIIT